MRQILVEIPSKWLALVALLLAVAALVRDVRGLRREGRPMTTTPLLLMVAAWVLMGLRGGAWRPSSDVLASDWVDLSIYSYGVMFGTSLVVGWFVAMRFAKQDGIPTEQAAAIYMWSTLWAIVGARVLYVLTNVSAFRSFPDALMLQKGGMVAYGGMIGGFLASWYGCHRRKIPLLKWADVAAPSVVLGTGITRIGCFLYGCDYGRRTDLAWGVAFPNGSPAWDDHIRNGWIRPEAVASLPVHPTQIYESLAGFALFAVLLWLRSRRTFSGQVFLGWVLGYGMLRPLIELLRADDQRGSVGPFSTSQFIGCVAVVLGLVLWASLMQIRRRDPSALRYWEPVAPEPQRRSDPR